LMPSLSTLTTATFFAPGMTPGLFGSFLRTIVFPVLGSIYSSYSASSSPSSGTNITFSSNASFSLISLPSLLYYLTLPSAPTTALTPSFICFTTICF
jgi:hypothetical protein